MLNRMCEYTGESSRGLYQRAQEHKAALKNQQQDSPLWKHCVMMHNSIPQEFELSIVRKHKSAFAHQIHEAILINHGQRDLILNSKIECNLFTPPVPPLCLLNRNWILTPPVPPLCRLNQNWILIHYF